MNIVVIGLGSMGKRRIRLLRELYPEYTICGVDGREDRRTESAELFKIRTFPSIEEAAEQDEWDCAFVCTSPLSHNSIIEACLTRGWNVFTELNLVSDGYEKNMALAQEKKCTLFLSSTFFYREEIRYIRKKVGQNGRWNYIYHIGQYLPDWHPWETYQDFFVGDQRTNGCREIMAIELPWLTACFGTVADVHAVSDKMTDLQIRFMDNYIIELIHENGNKGVLIVDVVSPCAVRRLEVYGEKKYLKWDGTPESLCEYDAGCNQLCTVSLHEVTEHREGYQAFVVENAYKNEITEFFDVAYHGKNQLYGFEQDEKILKLIDRIEGVGEDHR